MARHFDPSSFCGKLIDAAQIATVDSIPPGCASATAASQYEARSGLS
jgi:hypothetical protein